MKTRVRVSVSFLAGFGLVALAASAQLSAASQSGIEADERIVDCLLPGQIRKIGDMVYQTPPRPAHKPAIECTIQGGDFLVYDRANFEESLAWWIELANKENDPQAMLYVGEIFERGLSGEPDYARAATWYQKAADAGSVPAMISLAQFYKQGHGVGQDMDRAKQLYAEALGDDGPIEFDSQTIEPPVGQLAELKQEIEEQRSKSEVLAEELARAQAQFDTAQTELEQLRQAPARDEDAIERLRNEIERADASAARYEGELNRLRIQTQELTKLRVQLEEKEREADRLSQLLAAAERQLDTAHDRLVEANQASNAGTTDHEQMIQSLRQEVLAATGESNRYRQQLEEVERQSVDVESMKAALAQQSEDSRKLEELLSGTSNQLNSATLQLTEERSKTEELAGNLAETQAELQALRSERNQDSSRLQKVSQLVKQREQALDQQQTEMDRLRQEVHRVATEAEGYRVQLKTIEDERRLNEPVEMVGPTIEIIEPTLVATRGLAVASVPTSLPQRQIVGRVLAPAGLLTLTINDVPRDFNNRGVFKHVVSTGGSSAMVRIAAIDNQGKRAERNIQFKSAEVKQEVTVFQAAERFRKAFGNYHALLIGNSDYEYFPDLKTPRVDVDTLAEILQDKYQFRTTVLHDATRAELYNVLYKDLLPTLTKDDNLLIYYAGHGDYVENVKSATWLPVDAEPDNLANYFWTDELTKYLNLMRAKQILVVSDSCYSGALTRDASARLRGGLTREEYAQFLKTQATRSARVALVSGGMKPVLDQGGGDHSIFARALIDVLNDNGDILPSADLWQKLRARVGYDAEALDFVQEPEWAPIKHSGHEGGDFYLIPIGT